MNTQRPSWILLVFFLAILIPVVSCGGGGSHNGGGNPVLPQLTAITISPSNPSLVLGSNAAFTANGKYSDGTTKDVTTSVQWSSGDTSTVWLNNVAGRKGTATPRASGSTTVTATLSGLTGTTNINVTALLPRYGFVLSQDDTLSKLVLDRNSGSLSAKGYVYLGPSSPIVTIIDSAGRFLFFIDAASDSVWAYSIDSSSGALSEVNGSPFSSGAGSAALAIDAQGRFLYVANHTTGKVSAFSINATGVLSAVAGSPFAAGQGTAALAIDPSGHFLFAANQQDNTVSAFVIGATGGLTTVASSPFSTGPSPTSMCIDPTGQFVYLTNTTNNTITAHTINATSGALTIVAGSPFTTGEAPISLSFEPGGRYLYVANRGSLANSYAGSVSAYAVSPDTGALTVLPSSPNAGSGPRSITVDASGSMVYVANEFSNDVWTFAINGQNGQLTLLRTTRSRMAPVSMALTAGTSSVSVTPTFAYAVGAAGSSVGGYIVSPSTGTLAEIQGSPFGTAGASISLATHPSGKFLYVANYWNYKVSAYAINSTSGALASVPGSPYAFPSVNSGPYMIVPDPSGRFLYMTNGYDLLTGMSIDSATGALSSVGWNPVQISTSAPWGPNEFVIDPTGRFLYVSDSSWLTISAFQINQIDGSLTEIGGSPFSLGSSMGNYPKSIQIDPSGKYLYVALRCASWAPTCGSNTLYGFSIDTQDGGLTALSGSPWVAPISDIVSMIIGAHGQFLYINDGGGSNIATAKGTYGFVINPLDGTLSALPAFPFQPSVIAFLNSDPTGYFVYGGNLNASQIETYTIDPSTGALAQTQALSFAVGGAPWAVAVGELLK